MPIADLEAIDVHGHFGTYLREDRPFFNQLMGGDPDTVVRRARRARTAVTVVSPLRAMMPRGKGDPIPGNLEAAEAVETRPELMFWVVVAPGVPATFDQARELLASSKCAGIKIHPEEHCYPIREHGEVLFRFAAECDAIVLTHSGEENSLPEDYVPFAKEFPEVKLILAHLGCSADGDPTHQIRAIQLCERDNVFVDTSSAVGITSGLLEWAVGEIGADRILYGTDTPLYFAPMQRSRVEYAEIDDGAKRLILRDNAVKLLGQEAVGNVG